jgi:phosphoglycerate dehydrogenase-like enzyme
MISGHFFGTSEDSVKQPIVVIVTEPEFHRAEDIFSSAPDIRCIAAPGAEEDLAAAIRQSGARFVIVGSRQYRDALYAALPSGGVIARFGVGYDGLDTESATRAGVLCTNTPGVLDQSVAEFTMLLILAAARHLTSFASEMRNGLWTPRVARELRGQTLAVIGCGHIGGAVARIASDGFQMKVTCVRRRDDCRAAVREASFVSLHIPATPDNARFMNRDRLAMLSAHTWLINTARGVVVDEGALYDALVERRIAGAALDVFQREPYEPVDPTRDLRALPNVILTPHVGSNTPEASRRIAERALRNVRLADAGEFAAMDLLNPEVLMQ